MVELLVGIGIGAAVVAAAFYVRPRTSGTTAHEGEHERRLEEYPFYPFLVNARGHVEFSADDFNEAVEVLLEERNRRAAGELIVIGEQNLVRNTLRSDKLNNYKRFYDVYSGDLIVSDNDAFLENYRRLVNQIGRSFPHTGIEVLLHNLVNPSRSLVAIENGEVTGRSTGSGATNLVLDLKTRRQRGEDKVNYELNIGARQFKCTTVPIFRPDYGLVGAVCVNVDTHFIRDAVVADQSRLNAFIDNLVRTDFELDENILSPDEYQNALSGKRHYLDEAIRASSGRPRKRELAAILFSDIVGFTALMGTDEAATVEIMSTNDDIHSKALSKEGGHLLKKLGDGLLASFSSASGAVAAARDIQHAVAEDSRYQVRIGIHLGEVVIDEHDIHGDGVNIASRIQGEMEPGTIGMSEVVYDNIKNKEGFQATPIGQRELKNVATPISLYVMTT